MREGWSIKVTRRGRDIERPVEWYLVAEQDEAMAIAAVKKTLGPGEALIELGQKFPVAFFRSREMAPGEVAYLYRRGASRKLAR